MLLHLLRIVCVGFFVFVSFSCQAQPVITEYFLMREGFKIDLNDKKVQKTVYIKGVLDINWSVSNLTLAITYDPRQTESRDVLKSIQEAVSLNSAGILSLPFNTK